MAIFTWLDKPWRKWVVLRIVGAPWIFDQTQDCERGRGLRAASLSSGNQGSSWAPWHPRSQHFTFNSPLLGAGVALRADLCRVLSGAEGVAVSGDWTPGTTRCLGGTLQTLFQVGQSKREAGWSLAEVVTALTTPFLSHPHLYPPTPNLQQLLVLMEESGGELRKELQECQIWGLTGGASWRKLRQGELDAFPWLRRIILGRQAPPNSLPGLRHPVQVLLPPPGPSLSPRDTRSPMWLLLLGPDDPPSETSLPASPVHRLRKIQVPCLLPILPYLCSMTTRSRFCNCWGPKLKANLLARSLISMKAGSSFRPWGPCSCSSSVYNWDMAHGKGRNKIEQASTAFLSLSRNSKGLGTPSAVFTFFPPRTLTLFLTALHQRRLHYAL